MHCKPWPSLFGRLTHAHRLMVSSYTQIGERLSYRSTKEVSQTFYTIPLYHKHVFLYTCCNFRGKQVCMCVCSLVLFNLLQFSSDRLSALTPHQKMCGPPCQPLCLALLVYLCSSSKVLRRRDGSVKRREGNWETEIEFIASVCCRETFSIALMPTGRRSRQVRRPSGYESVMHKRSRCGGDVLESQTVNNCVTCSILKRKERTILILVLWSWVPECHGDCCFSHGNFEFYTVRKAGRNRTPDVERWLSSAESQK